MISSPLAASSIRLARVTYVHPEGQKMEVIFLDTGDYGRDVQVMTPYGGTDFGFTGGIPSPEEEGHDVNLEDNDAGKRHILAVVATLQGIHICLGYLYPQITHMAFTKDADKNRLIERHTSDFVRTIDDQGNMDLAHPSGAHITISEAGSPASLEGKDFDGQFKLKHNLRVFPQVGLQAVMAAGAGITGSAGLLLTNDGVANLNGKFDVNVTAEDRDMTLRSGKNMTAMVGQDLYAQVEGWVDITAAENISLNTRADCEVNAVNARIKASQNALLSGGAIAKAKGPDVVLEGAVQVTSNSPLTYVKGDLIVAGALILGGSSYDPDSQQAPAAGEGGAAVISGGESITLRANNVIIEGIETITLKAPAIVIDGAIEGDLHVNGIVYDQSVGPGD